MPAGLPKRGSCSTVQPLSFNMLLTACAPFGPGAEPPIVTMLPPAEATQLPEPGTAIERSSDPSKLWIRAESKYVQFAAFASALLSSAIAIESNINCAAACRCAG